MKENVTVPNDTPRRSGRYPWGSGKDPHQHCYDGPDLMGHIVQEISAKAVEMQDNIIHSTIQYIGGVKHEEITLDKNKVLDMLKKHSAKAVVLRYEGPRRHDSGDIQYSVHCPSCDYYIANVFRTEDGKYYRFGAQSNRYCSDCGQKLDWSQVFDNYVNMGGEKS